MSISDDCTSGIHEFCSPCECECHKKWQEQLLDLITLMPDFQTQEIIDYIMDLRRIRAIHANPKT
jgi:hypothetical protein